MFTFFYKLKLDNANFEGQVITIDNISDKEIGTEPFAVNAQSSNNLLLTYEVLSGSAILPEMYLH